MASITLVVPQIFEYHDFINKKGIWELTNTLENPVENPGMKYLTFELKQGPVACNLLPWVETTLFTFKNVGDCPDSLYLMHSMIPSGVKNTEIEGQGQANGQTHQLKLCGIADPAAWDCLSAPPSDQASVNENGQFRFSEKPELAIKPVRLSPKNNTVTQDGLTISPNPATDWLDVSFRQNWPEADATISLMDLQGRAMRSTQLHPHGRLRLNLEGLFPGVYVVVMESGGRVLARERVVKM